jgi:hypothetical protein
MVILSVVVAVNDGLAAIPVLVFFLNHGCIIAGLPLFDDGRTIAVTVMVMVLAYSYTSADRSDASPDIISHRGASKRRDSRKGKQYFLHSEPFLSCFSAFPATYATHARERGVFNEMPK